MSEILGKEVGNMPLYYIEIEGGNCGIREAKNKEQAWRDLLREEGTSNAKSVRLATKEDISWIAGMGGCIPERR